MFEPFFFSQSKVSFCPLLFLHLYWSWICILCSQYSTSKWQCWLAFYQDALHYIWYSKHYWAAQNEGSEALNMRMQISCCYFCWIIWEIASCCLDSYSCLHPGWTWDAFSDVLNTKLHKTCQLYTKRLMGWNMCTVDW